MKKFNFKTQIQELIKNKELTEVNLVGAPTYKVGLLLSLSDDYLTFIEVSSAGLFNGIIICQIKDIEILKFETIYLSELKKKVNFDKIFNESKEYLKDYNGLTFETFMENFQNSKRIVNLIDKDDEGWAGRVINQDEEFVVLDEYYIEYGRRFGRSLVQKDCLSRLEAGVNWLKTIERALEDKGI